MPATKHEFVITFSDATGQAQTITVKGTRAVSETMGQVTIYDGDEPVASFVNCSWHRK